MQFAMIGVVSVNALCNAENFHVSSPDQSVDLQSRHGEVALSSQNGYFTHSRQIIGGWESSSVQ